MRRVSGAICQGLFLFMMSQSRLHRSSVRSMLEKWGKVERQRRKKNFHKQKGRTKSEGSKKRSRRRCKRDGRRVVEESRTLTKGRTKGVVRKLKQLDNGKRCRSVVVSLPRVAIYARINQKSLEHFNSRYLSMGRETREKWKRGKLT